MKNLKISMAFFVVIAIGCTSQQSNNYPETPKQVFEESSVLFYNNSKHFVEFSDPNWINRIMNEDLDGSVSNVISLYKNGMVESIGAHRNFHTNVVDIDSVWSKYGTWIYFNPAGYLDSICTYGEIRNPRLEVDTFFDESNMMDIVFIDSIIAYDICRMGDQYYFDKGNLMLFQRYDENCSLIFEADSFPPEYWGVEDFE